MNGALKPNLLSLPKYALNQEVEDLPDRVKDHISPALEYACRSWCNHLSKMGVRKEEDISCVLNVLRHFLEQKFLPWLEVVSILGGARDAVVAVSELGKWFSEVCLTLLCNIAQG